MSNFTIFYTDDDEDDLSIFEDAVSSLSKNIKLETYNSGDKLLVAIRNLHLLPNIIFLDLNMPGKNGFDVLTELRNLEKNNDIPIIIFSTSNESSIIKKCIALGATYFITKPVSMKEIVKSIDHALKMNWKDFVPTISNFVYKS